ncbi:MAG: DinB family protein [Nitrolancea sp.]
MQTLRRMARHNAWENARVFDTCAAIAPEQLSEEARGTYGSVGDTLAHLAEVEDIYLLMLRGDDVGQVTNDDSYMTHDTAWFANRSRELSDGYRETLESNNEAWLGETFVVPWFGFPITRRDGLLQVWMHSAQHRAQVLSALGSHGIEVPDVDYIYMLSLEQETQD